MTKETLLEKAKAQKRGRCMTAYDKEKTELALAYLKGEITITQAASALNFVLSGNVYPVLISHLRSACLKGKLEIKISDTK